MTSMITNRSFFAPPYRALVYAAAMFACLALPGTAHSDWQPAGSADDFVDRIGVATHWGYGDTPYGFGYDKVRELLAGSGIRHIRDGWSPRSEDLYARHGIKTTVVFGPDHFSITDATALLAANRSRIAMVEGPNEPDLFLSSAGYKGKVFPEGPRLYMTELYAAIKGNAQIAPIPLIASTPAFRIREMGPLTAFDLLNTHSYAGGAPPSESLEGNNGAAFRNAYSLLGPDALLKRLAVTESGYHTALGGSEVIGGAQSGVSERAQARYLPRHFAIYYNAGIVRTFIYEFADEFPDYKTSERESTNPEACFGIIRHDFTPKPAYHALKNLIDILKEQSWNPKPARWEALSGAARTAALPSSEQALNFSLSGDTGHVRHTLLRKSDGRFYLLLWQEVSSFDRNQRKDIIVPPADVTLSVAAPIASARFFQPGSSGAAQTLLSGTVGSGGSARKSPFWVRVPVPDEIVVVELTPARSAGKASSRPAEPANLRATTTATTATIAWTPPVGSKPITYFVSRMGAFVGSTTTPRFEDRNLQSAAGYTYEVRACDTHGAVSAPVSVVAHTINAFPDLVVTDISLSPENPKPGDAVKVVAIIRNIGTRTTPSDLTHGVAFYVDDVFVSWSDSFAGPLAPGESKTVTANNGPKGSSTFVWTGVRHKIRALVDDINRIPESDEINNQRMASLPVGGK